MKVIKELVIQFVENDTNLSDCELCCFEHDIRMCSGVNENTHKCEPSIYFKIKEKEINDNKS